jgi:Chalcone isomerase-like
MRPVSWKSLVIAASLVGVGGLAAGEMVGVAGTSARFATAVEVQVAGKSVKLALTGATLRKRAVVSVYSIASYLQDGVSAKSAEQLAAADGVKLLLLVLERDVNGRDMADAIQTGIRLNYPPDAFASELGKVMKTLGGMDLRKGDHVMLTAIPRVGLRCQVVGKTDVVIENPAFARAIWDIYLGRNNLGDAIKAGLTSRL